MAKRTVEQVREACPGIIQLSTGGMFDYADRMRLVEAKPAMATLNPCTMSFADAEFRNPPLEMRKMAARMIELGIKPEVELYDVGHLGVMLQLVKERLAARATPGLLRHGRQRRHARRPADPLVAGQGAARRARAGR